MAEPMTGAGDTVARCTWCSAPLPAGDPPNCPSCGATLASAAEPQLPGVTTLDTEAILRARSSVSRPRSRILSFITGDVEAPESTVPAGESLAPPSAEVRREMLRLAIAAEVADLEAEVQSLATEAALEAGAPLASPSEAVAVAEAEPVADGEAHVAEAAPAAADAAPAAEAAAADAVAAPDTDAPGG